jgi:DNA end-binding protein Ku
MSRMHIQPVINCMRAYWSGFLTFGLISVPVKMHRAIKDSGVSFDLLHEKDHSPIRYARVCQAEGKEIPYDEIVRGYEYRDGEYIVLTDADFERANVRKAKQLEIELFTDAKGIDPLYFGTPYYLLPAKEGEKAYALLREALWHSGKAGVARFAYRGHEHLCLISARDKALIAHQLRYHEEIALPERSSFPEVRAEGNEVDLALALVEQLSAPFEARNYGDTYARELIQVIKEKAEGKKARAPEQAPKPTSPTDLLPLLRASLEKTPRRTVAKKHKKQQKPAEMEAEERVEAGQQRG